MSIGSTPRGRIVDAWLGGLAAGATIEVNEKATSEHHAADRRCVLFLEQRAGAERAAASELGA